MYCAFQLGFVSNRTEFSNAPTKHFWRPNHIAPTTKNQSVAPKNFVWSNHKTYKKYFSEPHLQEKKFLNNTSKRKKTRTDGQPVRSDRWFT